MQAALTKNLISYETAQMVSVVKMHDIPNYDSVFVALVVMTFW